MAEYASVRESQRGVEFDWKVTAPNHVSAGRQVLCVATWLFTGLEENDIHASTVMKESAVGLGEEFHADLEWWTLAAHQRLFAAGVSLYSPFYHNVR